MREIAFRVISLITTLHILDFVAKICLFLMPASDILRVLMLIFVMISTFYFLSKQDR
jgi:hypothetical protein